jgi:hypothetical protein
MGNNMTLMEGAIKVYPTAGMDEQALAQMVVIELGRMTQSAVSSGMAWAGQ